MKAILNRWVCEEDELASKQVAQKRIAQLRMPLEVLREVLRGTYVVAYSDAPVDLEIVSVGISPEDFARNEFTVFVSSATFNAVESIDPIPLVSFTYRGH